MHRIAEVLMQECVSIRAAAQQMKLSPTQVRAELDPGCDLPLSALYRWQRALNVPVTDLLREPGMSLSPQVQFRSGLLKAMRTVRSIQEQAEGESVRLLATQLVQQLGDLMPELNHVTSWPAYGQRRKLDEYGAIVDKQVPDDLLMDPPTDL
jgi:hypothetical protein